MGSGSLLWDRGHVKLICSQAFLTSTQSASTLSGPGYDDMTNQSVHICCGCKVVRPFSGPNKVMFFPKAFVKSLTHQHGVQTSNVDTLNIIFTWETDWINLTQGGFLPCWCEFWVTLHMQLALGSSFFICYLYSDMFTPYQATTRTTYSHFIP